MPDNNFADDLKQQHFTTLHERVTELEKAVEGLYDLIEELAKKI